MKIFKPKQWKKHELFERFKKLKSEYFSKIGLKDKLLHKLFEDVIEKFAIASFVYGYEIGRIYGPTGVYTYYKPEVKLSELPKHPWNKEDFKFKTKGGATMPGKEVTINATVESVSRSKINFEFGRTQGSMWISGSGLAARKLKLSKGDKVQIVVKTL